MNPEDQWLSLHAAAELLGVHSSTVRIWSDKGLLPVYRTKGGHRRYKKSEVTLWAKSSRGEQFIDPLSVVQAAVHNIRMQISEGHLESEAWYQKLDEAARMQYRQSAHSLFQGLVNYLLSNGEVGTSEAHSIGYEYASRARRFGLNSVEAARAFLFFRNVLLESVIQVYQEANAPSGRAWADILRRVNTFADSILLHLLETYQAMK
ncbi:MAG TPA: helix-turn-helix domain-containing protein [Anaerolineales bacterium]